MAQMIKEVDERQEELVIKSHAEILQRGIAQVKRITPILISSIKLYLNTTQQRMFTLSLSLSIFKLDPFDFQCNFFDYIFKINRSISSQRSTVK